ncbi:hypothetical protein GpartN1_g6696.t1 [Galdieria partita]|uniref:RNB domain-containing protein n=1 Tax=Galdieria partita TaxID=83374 RepID=A0A9C7UTU3_9RHOD|nr:hypothetical protein GpartN1_g6696.t1 [Galdieria partita]
MPCFIIFRSSFMKRRAFPCCYKQTTQKPSPFPVVYPRYSYFIGTPYLKHSSVMNIKSESSFESNLLKHSWISYIEKGKLMHGVVLDAPVSRRGGKDLVLQVLGCHIPSLFGQQQVVDFHPYIISMGNVVDIYEGSQDDEISIPITTLDSHKNDSCVRKYFGFLSSRVETILFSILFQKVEEMYQSFSKMDNERSFRVEIFCKYLFPGQFDLPHWIVTGLVLHSLKQHFRRGPPGQGFIAESLASRRSKSLVAWKLLWNSCCRDGNEWNSKSPYDRGKLFSTSPLLFVDAVHFIGHLEQCLYEGYLDKEAQVVLKALNRTPNLESARLLLEECGGRCSISLNREQLQLDHPPQPSSEEYESWMHPILRQREKKKVESPHTMQSSLSFRSYCLDTQDSIALDDAISVERVNDHYVIVSVHIINVASYIPMGCPLDEEAKRREETLYMKNKTFHMLPPKWLRLLSFSTEWYNDTLAARFHIDISQNYKIIKEELVPMQIPPIHHCYRLSRDGVLIEQPNEWMDKDWNILWTLKDLSIPHKISKTHIEWLLDDYLTRASQLIRKHILSVFPQQDKDMEKLFHRIVNKRKRLGTRPLRKYEDLMIQRLIVSSSDKDTIWKDILQYEQNKKDRMKHIRLNKVYTRFFQQLVFQRKCWMNEQQQPLLYVTSDIWESLLMKKYETNHKYTTLRIFLWGLWFTHKTWTKHAKWRGTVEEMHLFQKPEELDEVTEKTCLGALAHLAFDKPNLIEDWKEKGKDYFMKKKYKQAIDCYTQAIKEWQKEQQDKWTGCLLYSNRAAAQLALKNYAKVIEDCRQSLELGTFEKSYYRGCIAALAIQKWKQAQIWLQQAKENNALEDKRIAELEDKISRQRREEETKQQEIQRQRQKLEAETQVLINALKKRNIRLGLPLFVTQQWTFKRRPQVDAHGQLSWPVLFVYPPYEGQSDLLENCQEDVKLCELLSMLFDKRPPWDYRGLYHQEHLQVFYYTHWTPCLEEWNSAVEYLYGNGHMEASPVADNEMGTKIVVSQELSLSQILSRKDYVVPLYPVFFVWPQ